MTSMTSDHVSVARVLAAFGYDSILLFGLMLLATFLVTLPAQLLFDIQVIGDHAFAKAILWALWLFLLCGFYVWFWTHGGQTLGMRAWRIRVVDKHHQQPISLQQALIRLFVGTTLFGLSTLWIWLSDQHESLHDKAAQTRLLLQPKVK